MPKKMDEDSRGVLSYRPNIKFIEPEVEAQDPTPVEEPAPEIEDIVQKRHEVKQLAKAVNALATALQAKADIRAKNMIIRLDPKVDAAAVQAIRRMYPDADPLSISYPQYKACKENMREMGEAIGKKALITADEVAAAIPQSQPGSSQPNKQNQFGGWNTESAKNGYLRPEVNERLQIIPPLDISELQDVLLKILVNFLWKNFIKPIIPLPLLPDTLVSVDPKVTNSMVSSGISVPGEKKPKKQKQPEVPDDIPEDIRP